MVPPSSEDEYTFQFIDSEKNLYLCFTHFGQQAKWLLHCDDQNESLHLIPFTFANPSISRLLIFLTNQESLSFFTKNINKEWQGKPLALYFLDEKTQEFRLYPLTFSKENGLYQFEENNFELFKDCLYLPFVEEISKQRLLNLQLNRD